MYVIGMVLLGDACDPLLVLGCMCVTWELEGERKERKKSLTRRASKGHRVLNECATL